MVETVLLPTEETAEELTEVVLDLIWEVVAVLEVAEVALGVVAAALDLDLEEVVEAEEDSASEPEDYQCLLVVNPYTYRVV